MKTNESIEDYLERILMLSKKHIVVRAIDIANDMHYSRPSISIALKKLKENELIDINTATGGIELTTEGMKIASSTYERHEVISKMLMFLGVSEETALKDACRLEHDISEETFQRFKEHYQKFIETK